MRHIDIESLSFNVCSLACLAGQEIQKIYAADGREDNSPTLVAHKADDSPLTLADLASHRIIAEGLRYLTPRIPVVSEEDADSMAHRRPDQTFWLIDPLDGTKEFLARNGEFTVNIALVIQGEAVWGVVHAPVLGQTYWGGKAFGAWRQAAEEAEPIRVASAVSAGGLFRVVASKSHLNSETAEFINRLGCVDLVQAGSSLKFCRIAESTADVYPRLAPTCEWDTAAAQAVVEGAGGHVYDIHGVPLRYGKPDVLNPHFIAASVSLIKLFEK